MKNIVVLLVLAGLFWFVSCKKDTQSEKFKLLTGPLWSSESLLANGEDASGPDGFLKAFKGDYKFNEDGTGNFGNYVGVWSFTANETQLKISSDSLNQGIPITTNIAELTNILLHITVTYPNVINPTAPIYVSMTFKAN